MVSARPTVVPAGAAPTDRVNVYGNDWALVRGWALTRIADNLNQLETPGLETVPTEALRGEIRALRALLAFGEPASTPGSVTVAERPYV